MLFVPVDQTLWHEAVRAAAEGWDCMMRLVGQIHCVAERALGQKTSSSNKTVIAEHYSAGSAANLFDVCVCMCVRALASFWGETTMFNLDISTTLAGVKPSCVCFVVVNQPKKRS